MSVVARWQAGWWQGAQQLVSPNFGPRPAATDICLAVIHSISLPPGIYGGDAIERLFTNRLDWDAHPYFQSIRGLEVSSHFLIRRGGEVQQFVSCDDRAWHAGSSSWMGQADCNNYAIGIELEGLEGETFEAVQYGALAALLKAMRQQYPLRHVVGHEHIAPGRKMDPGSGFDWALLHAQVAWPAAMFASVDGPQSGSSA
jgi:N-acetyl-anhydromuramoyl-L-alanine amidase